MNSVKYPKNLFFFLVISLSRAIYKFFFQDFMKFPTQALKDPVKEHFVRAGHSVVPSRNRQPSVSCSRTSQNLSYKLILSEEQRRRMKIFPAGCLGPESQRGQENLTW